MQILIAEDQPTAALFLSRTLEKMGHHVAVARDGEEAWRTLRQGAAPLLISDWMMPNLDGPNLCRRIRAVGGDRYIYIILLTSRDRREDRLTGLRAGADDFLTKPPDADELALRLEIAERILAVHDQLARQNTRLAELATVDELTGTKNRRRFREDLELLFTQALRMRSSLSLIMLDIDHFKQFNDTFGHPAGDDVLHRRALTRRRRPLWGRGIRRAATGDRSGRSTGSGRTAADRHFQPDMASPSGYRQLGGGDHLFRHVDCRHTSQPGRPGPLSFQAEWPGSEQSSS